MKEINFTPYPNLSTERLALRRLTREDDFNLMSLRSNPQVNKYIERSMQMSLEEAHSFIKRINDGIKSNISIYWVIALKDRPAMIGTICLWNFSKDKARAELGYELDPDYRGKGLMNEAVKCVVNYGFNELHLNTIEAFTHKNNDNSSRLLRKNNFKLDPSRIDSDNNNNQIFYLTRHRYLNKES